jgi:catecholate siderophore receptor
LKSQDYYSLNTLANFLAMALVAPGMLLGQQAMAQSAESDVTQLAPVKVEGDGAEYQSTAV